MSILSWLQGHSRVARVITGKSIRTEKADQAMVEIMGELEERHRELNREVSASARMTRRLRETREQEITKWI